MSEYRRLISYIYEYEGKEKGKNVGFVKLEARNGQCRLNVNVKKVYVGGNAIGVYLLGKNRQETFIGNIFIRGGNGEFRTAMDVRNVDGKGNELDTYYGLTVHDVKNSWRSYTTIWEDPVLPEETDPAEGKAEVHAAEIDGEGELETSAGETDSVKERTMPMAQDILPGRKEIPAMEAVSSVVKEIEAEIAQEEERKELEQQGCPNSTIPAGSVEPCGTDGSGGSDSLAVGESTDGDAGTESVQLQGLPAAAQENRTGFTPSVVWPPAAMSSSERMPGSFSGAVSGSSPIETSLAESQPEPSVLRAAIPSLAALKLVRSGSLNQTPQPGKNVSAESGVQQENAVPRENWLQQGENVPPKADLRQERTALAENGLSQETMSQPAQGGTEPSLPPSQASQAKAEEPLQPSPELENPAVLQYLQETEENASNPEKLWADLCRSYPKIRPFDYQGECEILTIRPQDIGRLPRENWIYGNNSFLLHGYYNFRYLILARLGNEGGKSRYLLGVPGHYYSNEKYMASMFGFSSFVLSKKQPPNDGRFGYWYTDIRIR